MPDIRRYRGLAFVALWQVAPVVVHEDSAGRLQIHFAGGVGRYEDVTTNCEGQVVDTQDWEYAGGGAGVEYWPASRVRLNGFAGLIDSDDTEFSDFSFGGLAAVEWRPVGIGAGVTVAPGAVDVTVDEPNFEPTDIYPIVYLRVGNIDRWQLRLETTSDDGLERMGGSARIGFAYNQGQLRGTRVFGGLAMCHAGCEGNDGESSVLFLDLRRPVAERFDAGIGLVAGSGVRRAEWGVTLGGSWLPFATRGAPPVPLPAPALDSIPDDGVVP